MSARARLSAFFVRFCYQNGHSLHKERVLDAPGGLAAEPLELAPVGPQAASNAELAAAEELRRRTAGGLPLRTSTRAVLLVLLLTSSAAWAERGLFTFSLEAGQTLEANPTPGRSFALVGTSEYGLAERWSLSLSAGAELSPSERTFSLAFGPRATLFAGEWATLEAFALPELLSGSAQPASRTDLGLRLGLALRYQLMWGVGVSLQASVRGRGAADAPSPMRLQGLVLCGLFIES
ncbi:MAG: hypothetical protein ACYC8T_19375 [Myxococcaceae bacterium]